ncbi:MAG: STM4012 family radical SAM protein [Deltaproteobacteria bacterium]|nr:STM4012 family radical SAM protein [Deltaproteobacteria bacterium]
MSVLPRPYTQYVYGYPHKTAYRALDPSVSLRALWHEHFAQSSLRRDALFLYVHIPFCEMRCGFCNLFTTVRPAGDLEARYVTQLLAQAQVVRDCLGDVRIARMAVGGGTPTWLAPDQLQRVFSQIESIYGFEVSTAQCSVETSPETATDDRLAVLEHYGVSRVSIGVQTFDESESKRIGRPQRTEAVCAALDRIRAHSFETLNIDLIYGIPDQTAREWQANLRRALQWDPEEIYLYPLYVRPLTGLMRNPRSWDDERLARYREGRDWLVANGYTQRSMRMFSRTNRMQRARESTDIYRCEHDGMVGLGCGARSYTPSLHYSEEWAVRSSSVREIIDAYVRREPDTFAHARYGFSLSDSEQLHREVILSLLSEAGLADAVLQRDTAHHDAIRQSFFSLESERLIALQGPLWRLTAEGLAHSDAIGPWLFSQHVQRAMEDFTLR